MVLPEKPVETGVGGGADVIDLRLRIPKGASAASPRITFGEARVRITWEAF